TKHLPFVGRPVTGFGEGSLPLTVVTLSPRPPPRYARRRVVRLFLASRCRVEPDPAQRNCKGRFEAGRIHGHGGADNVGGSSRDGRCALRNATSLQRAVDIELRLMCR